MTKFNEARQLYLLEQDVSVSQLDAKLWHGSFNARESSLQQLSPYVGKLKSGMVRVLLNLYSKSGDFVLDPFSGSGVVPLEAVLANRRALANDLSPYAYNLTRGKLETPGSEKKALEKTFALLEVVEKKSPTADIANVPEWVQSFYHPDTLREILIAFETLKQQEDYFLTACLLGILHHVRPGFLSYPASHLVPYLRKAKYPPETYPKMYEYRDLRSRLIAKVKRAYRNSMLPVSWEKREYKVWQTNSMELPLTDNSTDTIISSPPYFGALDYARDNRLRLWFLGCENWKELDASLTAKQKVYLPQMSTCLKEMYRVLKPNGYCVLVLGDVARDGKTHRTAEILAEIAADVSSNGFRVETIYDDVIPDERRSRRKTQTTKFERILVMQKKDS
jgi:SAM-dependent methyltransferase